MMNNFIANIKAQLGTESSIDDFGVEKYAGSEVAEELLALDDMENLSIGTESMTEAIIELGLIEQEAALESQGLGLTDFMRFEGTLGNESLTNMVKRGGYNVVIAIKKMLSKIWKFVISIVDFFIICDGRWKSYSKLAKKYRGKLNSLKIHSGEKEEDKTYSIRKVEDAATEVKDMIDLIGTVKRKQPSGATPAEWSTSVNTLVNDMFTAVKGFSNGNATGGDNAKERYQEVKEGIDERSKEIRESDELPVAEAKKALHSALYTIETSCKKDIKWFKEYKKISKDVDQAIEKLGKEKASDSNDSILKELGELSQGLVEFKKTVNYAMKAANSYIQMVLADAAKVIAGETRIGD